MEEFFYRALEKLQGSKKILLVSPENPDIDSISCVCAFRGFLKWAKPKSTKIAMYCCDSLDALKENTLISFIEGGEDVCTSLPRWRPDCIVIFDYGNIERARLPAKFNDIFIIGFDHHSRAGPAPDIEIVDEKLSACTMMLYKFFRFAKYPFEGKNAARTLFAGIVADTGRFSNPATNIEAVKITADLDPDDNFFSEMMRVSRRRTPLRRLDVWLRILPCAEFYEESGLLVIVAGKREMERWNASRRDLFTAFGILRDTEEARIVACLLENDDGSWSGSLRPGPVSDIEAHKIAEEFGGGGHPYAAGFTFKGDINVLLAGLKNAVLLHCVSRSSL